MRREKYQNKIIKECLNATLNAPFFPEWEFVTLFGFTREEVKAVLDQWPDADRTNTHIKFIINSSFNNLTGYPIANAEKWPEFISVPREKLLKIYTNWRKKNFNSQ
jgi:hypothetical protein